MSPPKYSIVIPHYNIPQLLQRCLESIPMREDIQIIVVDNNSSPENRMAARAVCEQFPQVEYVQDEIGKGAGHARNIGLEHMNGEWLIFSDADDFFYMPFWNQIDDYVNDGTVDIIYFRATCVDSDTLKPSERSMERWDRLIDNYIKNIKDAENELKFFHIGPVSKIFKTSFIREQTIRFDETQTANDVMFCIYSGSRAKRIKAYYEIMYVISSRSGSLTTLRDQNSMRCRYEVRLRRNSYLRSIHKSQYSSSFPSYFIRAWKMGGATEVIWYFKKMVEYKVNPFWGYGRILCKKISNVL